MCGKGGGSPPVPSSASTAFQSTVTPSPQAAGLYSDFLNRANAVSTTPFNPAQLGQVAPLNEPQVAAGGAMYGAGMNLQDVGNQVAGYGASVPGQVAPIAALGMQAGNWDPNQVQAIMSPYIQDVVGSTQNWFNNQNAIQSNDLLSSAIRSGNAFGGDRAGVAQGVLAGQQQLAQAPVISGLYQQGYSQALDEFNKLRQLGLSGGQLALAADQLGLSGQQLALQGAQAGLVGTSAAQQWGNQIQAQQQRQMDVDQQNAMMQQAYPFQTLNWYGSILGGVGPLTGSFAQGFNTPPSPSGLSTGLGLASSAIGLGSSLFPQSGASAAAPAPAASATGSDTGFRRGGVVSGLVPIALHRRAQGGLVPINMQYGGSASYSDEDELRYRARDDSDQRQAPSDTPPSRSDTDVQGARKISVPNIYGQLKVEPRQLPQPTFPSSGSTQPQQKSDMQSIMDFGKSVVPLVAKAAPMLALLDRGGVVHHFADGGSGGPEDDPDDETFSSSPLTAPGSSPSRFYAPGGWVIPHLARGGVDFEDSSGAEPEPEPEPEPDEATDITGPVPLPKARPNPPMALGPASGGRMTWFNPRPYTYRDPSTGQVWTDTGARGLREGPHASDLPLSTPGFASPGSRGLGHWYQFTTPDGQRQIIQKTDVGPAGVLDLNAAAASRAYPGGPSTVPSGRASVQYIGKDLPSDIKPTSAPSGESTAGGPTDPDAAAATEGRGGGQTTRLPGMHGHQPEGFFERLAANPFWNFGMGALSNKSPFWQHGVAAGMQGMTGAIDQERKARVLDEQPKLITSGDTLMYQYPDGTIFKTNFPTTAGQAQKSTEAYRRSQSAKPFAVESETPGPFGSKSTKKDYYTIDPDTREVRPFTPQGAQPAAPQRQPAPAEPGQPPPAAPEIQQPAPARPFRQTEAAPAPIPPVDVGDSGTQPAQPAPQQAAPGQPVQQQTAGAQPAPQQQPTTTAGGPASPEDDFNSSGFTVGQITNPSAVGATRNEAALQGLNPEEARIIKGIADYTIDPSKIFTGKRGADMRPHAMAKVAEYDSSYNQALYPAKGQALKEFGVNGAAQKNLQSNNMTLQHLGDAMTATDKLQNSTIPVYNHITGAWQSHTGNVKYQAALAEYKAAVDAGTTEAAKTFRGAGAMSQRESQLWRELAGAYESPVTQRAILNELTTLVKGRVDSTAHSYNQIMGPAYARDGLSWMGNKANETIRRAEATDPEQNKPYPPSRFGITKFSGGPEEKPAPAGGGGGWMQDPATGNWKGPDGRTFDRSGKPLQ